MKPPFINAGLIPCLALLVGGIIYQLQDQPSSTGSEQRELGLKDLEATCGPRNDSGRFELSISGLRGLSTSDIPVETTGQLVRDRSDPSRWWLSGVHLNCCPPEFVGPFIELHADGKPWLERELEWYRVTGRLEPRGAGMVLVVESWMPATPLL